MRQLAEHGLMGHLCNKGEHMRLLIASLLGLFPTSKLSYYLLIKFQMLIKISQDEEGAIGYDDNCIHPNPCDPDPCCSQTRGGFGCCPIKNGVCCPSNIDQGFKQC